MYREAMSRPLLIVMAVAVATMLLQALPGWLAGLLMLATVVAVFAWLGQPRRR